MKIDNLLKLFGDCGTMSEQASSCVVVFVKMN